LSPAVTSFFFVLADVSPSPVIEECSICIEFITDENKVRSCSVAMSTFGLPNVETLPFSKQKTHLYIADAKTLYIP
jgi:hypothetical protein